MKNKNIIGTNFIITNKDLINEFVINVTVMLGELHGRRNYFSEQNELKYGGYKR